MDLRTLAICNLLFLFLYALTTFVYRMMYRKMQPGIDGCDWFIVSNLILSLPFLGLLYPSLLSHPGRPSFTILLAILGHLPLHRAFAELLERRQELWSFQLGLAFVGVVTWLILFFLPGASVAGQPLMLVTGLQYGLTGLLLFRVTEGTERVPGWFAGGMSVAFAACHFVWYGMTISSPDAMEWRSPQLFAPIVRLLVHGILALSFLLLAISRLQMHLQRETELDELTGLMNLRGIRRVAAQTIAQCCRRESPLALLMIDLDGFKGINDRMGHDAGDALLCAVAKTLVEILRSKDKVARLGGDEFCLMLPDTDEREAVLIAERCRTTIEEMVTFHRGQRMLVSACLGVACSPDALASWEELLSESDMAMYQAKRTGGNRVAIAERPMPSSMPYVREPEPLAQRAS